MIRRESLFVLASVVLLGSGACKSDSTPPAEAPRTTAAPAAAAQPSSSRPAFEDTLLALHTIHAAQVGLGTLAQKRAVDPRVKAFAERLIAEHAVALQKVDQIIVDLSIEPKDRRVTERLESAAARQTARLDASSGTDFDRVYLDEQISYNRAVLDALHKDLMPGTWDPQMISNIEEARERATMHLKEAQDLQAALGTRGAQP